MRSFAKRQNRSSARWNQRRPMLEPLEHRRVLHNAHGTDVDDFEPNDTLETATVLGSPVSLTLPGDFGGRALSIRDTSVQSVDVVVLVDESGSMTVEDREFLSLLIPQLDAELIGEGIEGNQYGLVGFSDTDGTRSISRLIQVGGNFFGDAAEFSTATTNLTNVLTEPEDGYEAIQFALETYPFREEAAKLFVLVTDEDRDEGNPADPLPQTELLTLLDDNDVALHGLLRVTIEDISSDQAFAIDNTGTGYLANASGGFFTSSPASITTAFGNTNNPATPNENYVQPIFARDGLVASLLESRAAVINEDSLATQSFSDILVTGFVDSLEQEPDQDFYRYTAHDTGMLIVNALFEVDPTAPGNLNMEILDADGNLIASSTTTTPNEQIVIPVVSQEVYYIHVFGATDVDINDYALEIENFAAPVPTSVRIDPANDSGMMNNDNVTADLNPRFLISADLNEFARLGIPIDTNGASGADVRIDIQSVDGPLSLSNIFSPTEITNRNDLWSVQDFFLPDGRYHVTASVSIFDGSTPSNTAFSQASEPLLLTIDTTAPNFSPATLLASSDTGMNGTDSVTNKMSPAFSGIAEENARVFLYATPMGTDPNLATANLVGEAAATGFAVGEGLGRWEITSEPLADGVWDFFTVVVDAAGNSSRVGPGDPIDMIPATPVTTVWIDTAVPNTPYLDLITDNGHGDFDNITSDNTPTFQLIGNDTVDGEDNPFPNDVIYRLYRRPGDGAGEVLTFDSFAAFTGFVTSGQISVTTAPLADGVHNFKLEVEDRAGNISPDFLLEIQIDTALAIEPTIDLLESSDSGMDAQDNVTNITMPAFTGLAEADSMVRIYATNVATGTTQLIGEGTTGSDLSDVPPPTLTINGVDVIGEDDDNIGVWEVTVEPLTDGVYDIVVESEDWAANVAQSEPLRIEIDTLAPNQPFLDLVEASDSGRHNDDNITNDNTPSLTMTSEDRTANPMVYEHLIAENFKFRIFDRLEETTEVLLFDSFADLGDFTVEQLLSTTTGLLADGIHNLKLEVEDRAGNISHDFLLDVLIDTVAPAAPTIALDAASDTGVPGYPDTLTDRITSDDSPTFVGRAEANAIVYMSANDIDQGLTVAVPLDGDDAFPNGHWSHTGDLNLNNQAQFDFDGLRIIDVSAEDVAGNLSDNTTLEIFVDTQGPRVESVEIAGVDDFNLFASKPATEGPTPLVNALEIDISDLPDRIAQFLYDALQQEVAESPGNYLVIGDNNGVIPIESVTVTQEVVAGSPAEATITLNFFAPLPDDRFTLTISDALVDPVGNQLDGNVNGLEPQDPPTFPSGDGIPGGSFTARFTVDSRAEVGVYAAGSVYVDTNGNEIHDPDSGDFTNRDITYTFGFTTDTLFAGNFYDERVNTGMTTADGFDKLAGYGKIGDRFRWIIDTTNDGVPDLVIEEPTGLNGLPVAGNFDGNADNGDEVGLLTPTQWWFDTDHDFQLDTAFNTNMIGYPIVGDFDGDGTDDLGTFTHDFFSLNLSTLGAIDGQSDTLQSTESARTATEFRFGFPGPRDRPVAADMDGDGIDDIGLWVPDRSGATPLEGAEWYFLVSGDTAITDRIVDFDDFDDELTVDFTPVPFGDDLFIQFGDDFGVPLVGNFDPPINDDGSAGDPAVVDMYDGRYHNAAFPADVDESGLTTVGDALAVISDLRTNGPRMLYNASNVSWKVDVNGDTMTSLSDALVVVAELRSGSGGEGEAAASVEAKAGGGGESVVEKSSDNSTDESVVDSAVVALLAEMTANEDDSNEDLIGEDDALDGLIDDLVD